MDVEQLRTKQDLLALQAQVRAIAERLDAHDGALLANNIAVQVLIATHPDLDRVERNLIQARGSLAATASPASASTAEGFSTTFDQLLQRLNDARTKRAQ
jgi:hypothetical protein